MGANAQIAVPSFTAGQTLTALQQTQINTGIPVFATTTTRDAAFSGSGEKVLAEGQFAYIEASDTLQVYNGTAWVGAVSSGLVPIVPTSVSVGGGTATVGTNGQVTFTSATTSLSLNGVFSSTYDNYRILYRASYSVAGDLQIRMRASGTDTATNYTKAILYANASSASAQNGTETYWLAAITSGVSRYIAADVISPNLAANTGFIGSIAENAASSAYGILNFAQAQTSTTNFDGMTFINSAAQTGTISVYGYTK